MSVEPAGDPAGPALEQRDAARLAACVAGGGVAVFPSDTVYGLCCDPDDEAAVRRLYALKGRPAGRPAAVMFLALEPALEALRDIPAAERAALLALLPGPVTLLLVNRTGRFLPACGPDPSTLGLRVPVLPERLKVLGAVLLPIMQSSANRSGAADARRLQEIPASLLEGADLVLDGGELPGMASTVVDLREYAATGDWQVLREGALPAAEVARRLAIRG
ncbi:MAG TPA: L-threonylcarbamoyladenylate synthase [Solirubrobacteraceae bacterium]|nr:L-threonylcarbamoyladenylate synthase [Solirubrobacteraceae bacterium]